VRADPIGAALDGFSYKLSKGDLRGLVQVKDRTGFQREIDRLRAEEIDKRFAAVAAAVQPVREWAGALREEFVPQLESARANVRLAQLAELSLALRIRVSRGLALGQH
jgi:hypothetical protein